MTITQRISEAGKKGYQILERHVCPWTQLFNKVFKFIQFGALTLAHVTPLGKAGDAAAWIGRIRPLFYTTFAARDLPKLFKKKGGIRENFFADDRTQRNYLKGLGTILGLTFAVGFMTQGAMVGLSRLRQLERLKKAAGHLGKVLPIIVLLVNMTGMAMALQMFANGKSKADAATKGSENATNFLGTLIATDAIPEFEGDGVINESLRAVSGLLGVWNAYRALRNPPKKADTSPIAPYIVAALPQDSDSDDDSRFAES